MNEISVKRYTPDLAAIWNRIVANARNGTFLHERSFMDYHADRFEDCSAIVFKGPNPIAVFPANRVNNLVNSHGGLTFGGLLYGLDQRATTIRDAFEALLAHYRSMGLSRLHYKPVPHIFQRYPAEEDLYALYLSKARLVRRDLSSVLIPAKNPKVSTLRKRGIKKAKSVGLKYVEGTFFGSFHSLLSEVLLRHNAKPVHSVAELSLLQSRFPERIKLVGAFDGEDLLAASWLFKFDGVLHFQYLASSDSGRDVGALDFIIDQVIESAAPDVAAISFGSSTENGGKYLNKGLISQKEGFGARGIVLDHYELDL